MNEDRAPAPAPGVYPSDWGEDDDEDTTDDGVTTLTDTEPPKKHRCLTCGHESILETPSIKAKAWCQGECDRIQQFKRVDHIK